MGIEIYRQPRLVEPVLFCGWPGIGNIGIIAIDTLRQVVRASEFGRIEPWDFFQPHRVVIENGLLRDLQFPLNEFYYRRLKNQDLMFFIGEEQTSERRAAYAEGEQAYRLANLVLDVAEKYNCRRVYTSGAAVAQIHHTSKSRVWAVANSPALVAEIKSYPNTILMSELKGRGGRGTITGLNGLMLGAAKRRGIEAICLMGEIPYYLQGAPWPYPHAARSVLEVLGLRLGVNLDFRRLEEMSRKVDQNIEHFLQRLYEIDEIPAHLLEEIEKLKAAGAGDLGPITDEEQKRMMEHLDELFLEEGGKDDKAV